MASKKLALGTIQDLGIGVDNLFGAAEDSAQDSVDSEIPDLLSTDATNDILEKSKAARKKVEEEVKKSVQELPIDVLTTYHDHPFRVRDDDDMDILVDSIRQSGIIVPLIVRELTTGEYEILAGHRRRHAALIVGLETVPCIVCDADDNDAAIFMVDSNAQRELTPSERANGYRIKLEALKKKGVQNGLYKDAAADEAPLMEQLAESSGISHVQISKYLRLAKLHPYMQELVDEGKRLSVAAGYLLSFLKDANQEILVSILSENENLRIKERTADEIRKYTETHPEFIKEDILDIIEGKKKARGRQKKLKFAESTFRDYFPKKVVSAKPQERISFVAKALEYYRENHPEEYADEANETSEE